MHFALRNLKKLNWTLLGLFVVLSSCSFLQITPFNNPPPSFDWLVMGYQGNMTQDQWLTSDSTSLYRGNLYINRGRYERHNTNNIDRILEWRIMNDPKKGKILSTKLKLDETQPNFHLYRAQVQHYIGPGARNVDDMAKYKGWPEWYTGIGRELVQSFSIRVPEDQRVDFPSTSVRNGLDDPTALHVWQTRTRFNDNSRRGNVLIAIYLRGDEWMLKNDWDRTPYFPGARFNGFKLGDAVPGEWLDLIIRMAPDRNNGEVDIYARKKGEENYSLIYEYRGTFYGPIDPKWIPSEIDAREVLGLPSYGIYPSTRLTHQHVSNKWLPKGIEEIEVQHSELRLLQYEKGKAPMDDIIKSVEYNF